MKFSTQVQKHVALAGYLTGCNASVVVIVYKWVTEDCGLETRQGIMRWIFIDCKSGYFYDLICIIVLYNKHTEEK
jgi:hypothetical protein